MPPEKGKKEIYLKHEIVRVGAGSTAKTTEIENYYQVFEMDQNHVEIQLLDIFDKPFGKAVVINKEELKDYIYCPDYFMKKRPTDTAIEKHVQCGDHHFERREYLSAEFEYDRALSLDGNHLKANLGKGKALYARGENEEARKLFSKLSCMDVLFRKENKHFFNEFGIELRKKGMFEEAISNYLKAISIDPKDEVLYYNLGRAYYDAEKYEEAIDQLGLALTVRPDFREAREFLSNIQSRFPEMPAFRPSPAEISLEKKQGG